jgi:hypothetical protein
VSDYFFLHQAGAVKSAMPAVTVSAAYFSSLKTSFDTMHVPSPASARRFDFVGAWGAAGDYASMGWLGGAAFGCIVGGLVTFYAGGVGCLPLGATMGSVGGAGGAAIGFVLGGLDSPYADTLSGTPDKPDPNPFEF